MNLKAMKYSALAAALVFIFGFGAMCLLYFFWRRNNPTSTLPGLFYYKAAAIGDPICLPLLAGTLCWHHLNQGKTFFSFGSASIAAFAVMFLAGAAIQAQWLISDQTVLNWSLPVQHHFNAGGWYHAAFFVLYLASAGVLFTEYLWYSTALPSPVGDFLLWFAAMFFGLLHFIDDYIDRDSSVRSLLTAALILVAVCAVLQTVQHIRLRSAGVENYIAMLCGGVLACLLALAQT